MHPAGTLPEAEYCTRLVNRIACVTQGGNRVEVHQRQYFADIQTPLGVRRVPGAFFWTLQTGEKVDSIDMTMFIVSESQLLLFAEQA